MKNKPVATMIVDIGILLALVAISLGIWFYPWVTLMLIAVGLCAGCFARHHSG